MHGRKPAPFELKRKDKVALQQLLRNGNTPLRIARRVQILLRRAQAQQRVKPLGEIVAQDAATIWRVCERYTLPTPQVRVASTAWRPRCTTHRVRAARAFFSEGERQAIEGLARGAPASVGWSVTHWSQRSLAQAAVEQDVVGTIHHTTIGDVLRAADLQPHRSRTWKTTIWDEEAVARTLRILWYYERIESLWRRGEVVVAVDEKPNLQVLERVAPSQAMRPGQIERQEFEYRRHGTLNLLTALTVHNGHMGAECLDKNDGAHFRPALCRLLHPYAWARRIHLVMDNGASHISDDTAEFLAARAPRVQLLLTPPDASWLNQAEALLEAFSERYLLRGSWCSRTNMIHHILAGTQEYNRHFAHPFAWAWSCRAFRFWLNNTPGLIRCRT